MVEGRNGTMIMALVGERQERKEGKAKEEKRKERTA